MFFLILAAFWEVLGPKPLQKFTQNRPRRSKKRFWDAFGTRLFLKIGVGRVLGGFGHGFGKILAGFWEGFGKILGRFLEGFWEVFWKTLE